MTTISVIDKCSLAVPEHAVHRMAVACHRQYEDDFAPHWGLAKEAYEITTRPGGEITALLIDDDPNAPGALAYHDDAGAKPDIVILVKTIMENGGTWLDGPVSVSAALSHEVLELIADPACDRFADAGNGRAYCIEVCDPVEEHVYEIDVDGVPVTVSNYVTDRWFDPEASGGEFDRLGVLAYPFQLNQGYAIVEGEGQEAQIEGVMAPWRLALRTEGINPFSRTYRRLSGGEPIVDTDEPQAPSEHDEVAGAHDEHLSAEIESVEETHEPRITRTLRR